MSRNTPSIPLARAIQDLRAELLAAIHEGEGEEIRFRAKPIELELQLGITWEHGGDAAVKFWVLELGAKGSYERAGTHTLKLTLEPVDSAGSSDVLINDPAEPFPK